MVDFKVYLERALTAANSGCNTVVQKISETNVAARVAAFKAKHPGYFAVAKVAAITFGALLAAAAAPAVIKFTANLLMGLAVGYVVGKIIKAEIPEIQKLWNSFSDMKKIGTGFGSTVVGYYGLTRVVLPLAGAALTLGFGVGIALALRNTAPVPSAPAEDELVASPQG